MREGEGRGREGDRVKESGNERGRAKREGVK